MRPTDLVEHPEGGRYREVFRSTRSVVAPDGATRSALTHIYFELRPGEVSRFHRVASDEVWNLYRGEGVRLIVWDGTDAPPSRIELAAHTGRHCHVVPAGRWQAAEPISDTVLVGCSVAPGFEFEDFALIDPASPEARRLAVLAPDLRRFVGA